MGKMHELLSVEPDLKGAAEKIINETINTFVKKHNHFEARHKNYEPLDEEGERFQNETQEMVTTVAKKLDHTKEVVSKYLDAIAQKELTNTEASAKLEIDGQYLIDVPLPATLLLALEGRLKQLREIYNAIPTLEPSESWKWDEQTKTYEAPTKETYKTKKVYKNHIKAEATDKHAAQVEVYTEDQRIGVYKVKRHSGMVTPAEKAALLARIDKLAHAVKKARQRANDSVVKELNISETLFNYINQPLKR